MAHSARKVLDVNKSERHIRGGLATREKYLHHRSIGKNRKKGCPITLGQEK
nr:sporulation transcriptional regulator SpoIIID [Blautia sp. Marseille-P3201T]